MNNFIEVTHMKPTHRLKNIYTLFICSFLLLAGIQAFAITTPCGDTVPYTSSPGESYSTGERSAMDDDARINYGATILYTYDTPSATSTYNCHGFAWHMSEGGAKRWINFSGSAGNNIYVTSGCYVECSISQATKVCYQYDHSAVRINNSKFKSKWGSAPLCTHAPGSVPSIYGSASKYYHLRNASLTANFTYANGSPCGTVNFTDTSTATDCSITAWNWNFGDGTTSTTRHPGHEYMAAGTYTATLTISGDWGASPKSISKSVTVSCGGGITVTSPSNGTSISRNTWYEITWVPANVTGNVRINLLQNGGYVGMIAGTVSNDGDRDFYVDECKGGVTINPGSNYQIELVSKQFPNVKGRSGYFTVTN